MNSYRFIALAVVTLVVLVLVFFLRVPVPPKTPSSGDLRPNSATSGSVSSERELSGSRVVVSDTTDGEHPFASIWVLDGWGRPMSDAAVFEERANTEWYDPADDCFIGSTAQDGHLQISCEGPRTLHVGKRGFLTQRILVSPSQEVRIELMEGASVRVRCTSALTGEPLRGVVVVARAPGPSGYREKRLEWDTVSDRAIPAWPVESAVFRERTGADGMAILAGLVPGPAGCWADAGDFAISSFPGDINRASEVTETGSDTYELRFLPIVALGYRMVGDDVIENVGRVVHVSGASGVAYDADRLSVLKERLVAKFPGSVFVVAAGAERLEANVVFRNAGEQQLTIPFRPLREVQESGPITIDAAALARAPVEVEDVKLRILNPSGSELVGIPFMLKRGSQLPSYEGNSGALLSLAHGRYTLVARESSIANAIGKRFEFVVDAASRLADGTTEVIVRLRVNVYPVTIELKQEAAAGLIARRSDGWRTIILSGTSPLVRLGHLPAGEYTFHDRPEGPALGELLIDNSEQGPLVVRLESSR
jgi:hypothetical protein